MQRREFSFSSGIDTENSAPSLERESSISLIDLLTPEGQAKFKAAVEQSQGSAVAVVHPFFPENTSELDDPRARIEYSLYVQGLQDEVQRRRVYGIPLILFEWQAYEQEELQARLTRMGVNTGEVFVLPTLRDTTPEPKTEKLVEVADQLKAGGLKEVTVSGSFLWPKNPNYRTRDFSPTTDLPILAQKYFLDGCVGYAMEKFLEAGVTVNLGRAYPGREMPQRAGAEQPRRLSAAVPVFVNKPVLIP